MLIGMNKTCVKLGPLYYDNFLCARACLHCPRVKSPKSLQKSWCKGAKAAPLHLHFAKLGFLFLGTSAHACCLSHRDRWMAARDWPVWTAPNGSTFVLSWCPCRRLIFPLLFKSFPLFFSNLSPFLHLVSFASWASSSPPSLLH